MAIKICMPRCYDFSSLNIIAFVFKNSGAKLHFWPSKLKDPSTSIHYTQFQNHFWHFIVSSTTCECQKFHDQALFQNVLSSISGIFNFFFKNSYLYIQCGNLGLSSDMSNTILSNIEQTRTSFLNIERTNFELNWAFTRFTKLLFKLTQT